MSPKSALPVYSLGMSDEDEDQGLKVIIPDELLAKFPPEEREAVRAKILEQFEGVDPDDLPGELVPELPKGATNCPQCNGLLDIVGLNREVPGMPAIDILTCGPCDLDFVSPTRIQ